MSSHSSQHEQLNLVPYLDIMINLVVFLLASTAMIVPMREAKIEVPGQSSTAQVRERLTVAVSPAGLAVIQTGGPADPPAGLRTDLARDPVNHSLPFERLTEVLRAQKDRSTVAQTLTLVADTRTPYSEVVATMDAAREDSQGVLYPGIELAVAVN